MDSPLSFQSNGKSVWWVDILLYFCVSLLISSVFCYVIFWVESSKLDNRIKAEDDALKAAVTQSQKDKEKEVLNYQSKINAFASLLKNHEFASNALAFIEEETNQNVWFKQITLDAKARTIQLSCEAENMNAFSRQVASLENNQYIKNMGTLNSTIGESARVSFNLYLTLDSSVFGYISAKTNTNKAANPGDQTINPSEQQATKSVNTNKNTETIKVPPRQ